MDGQDEESRRIYITREISRRGGQQFGRHQEVLLMEYQKRRRRIHPRTRPKDGLWPSPQLRRWRSCSPMILPDRWRSPHKGPVLKPASLLNSLYWACCVWVRSHLQWKMPPNWDPTIVAVCGKNLCASENDNRTRQGQREQWWPTYWTANGELPRGSQLSRRLAPRAWPSPPPGPRRPANLMGCPCWTLVEEYGGRAKRFQGAPRREQFLEIGVGAF